MTIARMNQYRTTLPAVADVFVLTCLVTLVVLMPGRIAAQDASSQTPAKVDRDDVLEMVDQLDAPEAVKRRTAELTLDELGVDALPHLPETDETRSKEANERLAKLRDRLQAIKASAALIDIKIYLDEVSTLAEALEAISRDSGVEFEYAGDKAVAIDSVPTPLPFWHAVDLVLDQAKLDVNFYGGDRETLLLVPRNEGRPDRVRSAAYTGVYRLEPTVVTAKRVLNQPALSGLNVSLEIAWEPRVTPIGLTLPIDEVEALLDTGDKLLPQASGDTIDVATNSDIAFSEFFLPMELPGGKAKKINRLSGVLQALLPSERQRFEIPLVGPETSVKKDAMTVTIESNRENGTINEVRVGIHLENADRSLESHRQWIFNNEAFVVGPDGGRIDHLGYQVYRQTVDGAGVGYLFDLGENLDDMTLVYISPTAVVKTEVPFVLADIPLP